MITSSSNANYLDCNETVRKYENNSSLNIIKNKHGS